MATTRSLLLSTYLKWINVFPELRGDLVIIFERYRHVLDAELQQRACEFYALASRQDDDELLQTVCEEMPPFPPRASTLLGRLNKKQGDTEGDKRIWVHGGKEANEDHVAKRKTTLLNVSDDQQGALSLDGLDLTGEKADNKLPPVVAGPNVDRWFEKLISTSEGILYEDVQIQVGIKSRYQGHVGQIAIYVGNKMPTSLTSFTSTLHSANSDALSVSFAKIPASTIASRTQVQQLLQVECKKVFTTSPVLSISYLAGSHQSISIRLPIFITKFFEHVSLNATEFFERWKLIGGPPREAQSIIPIVLTSSGNLDHEKHRQVVSGHNLNILPDIDPNEDNLVAAAVLHMSAEGKVGCLVRVEPNKDAKV